MLTLKLDVGYYISVGIAREECSLLVRWKVRKKKENVARKNLINYNNVVKENSDWSERRKAEVTKIVSETKIEKKKIF